MNTTTRLADITGIIEQHARIAISARSHADEARLDATAAGQKATNAREDLMTTLAEAAKAGVWTETEIGLACADVSKRQNDAKTQKSTATMLSEVKLSMLPNIRPLFAKLRDVRTAAWDDEDVEAMIAKKAGQTHDGILARVFSRRYQTLCAMMRAINDTPGLTLDSVDALLVWANSKDPNRDPKKLAARIEAACDALTEVSGLIGHRISVLDQITAHLRTIGAPEIVIAFQPPPEDVGDEEPGDNSGSEDSDDEDNSDDSEGDDEVTSTTPNDPQQGDFVTSTVVELPPPLPTSVDASEVDELLSLEKMFA